MRNLLLAVWAVGVLFATTGLSNDPIVIRPKSAGAQSGPTLQRPVVTYTDPNRPGFLIVRPQTTGGTTGGATLEPVRRQPQNDTPRPSGEPKPAEIPEPGAKTTPATPPAPAAKEKEPEDGRVVLETWDAVYLKTDFRVGYFHVVVREFERDGKKFLYATKSQKITVARFGQRVEQFSEDATTELPDGIVLTTLTTQGIGKEQQLVLNGKVADGKLVVTVQGAGGGTKVVRWSPGVVGVAKEATLFADRKPKPGDMVEYPTFEGRLNEIVIFRVEVKEEMDLVLVQGEKPRRVLRAIVGMEPIHGFQLPTSTVYVDAATFEPLRMDTDVPMLGGRMTVLRTTKEVALRPVGKVPDLFDVQSIPLDKIIPDVHGQGAVTYRVRTNGSVPADKVFPADDRQTVQGTDPAAKSADYRVAAGVPSEANAAKPSDGALSSSFFIDWDTDLVKQKAKLATAGLPATATALDKVKAVERWVNQNMRSTEFSQAMASCSNVANSLSGDCTEYAMLAAGLCRALGVPSRTAIGLVYAPDRNGRPFLAYHMWFEAYIGDRWIPFDATLGRGGIGPGHIKITSADWHEERSFVPLLPVLSVLGAGPKVEVVRVEMR